MVDAVEGERPSNNDAVRKTRQRRKTGIPSRYTPEMQFKKFIKEAREANFNIFGSEIDPGGLGRESPADFEQDGLLMRAGRPRVDL
jgi:hypothetical protein